MEQPPSESTRDADAQRRQWDRVAAGWKTWWRTIEDAAQPVSRRMLALAAVAPGQRVLDIATGIGEPALLAASRVGPQGRVVATDIAPAMLDIARERARSLGLANVEFVQADAARLDFPAGGFDAVLCRWGITSLPHLHRTLVAIRRLLSDGGAFATAVWEAGAKGRPLATLAAAVAHDVFEPSSQAPETPAMAESAAGALEDQMRAAGFAEVRVETMTLALEFSSIDDCMRYLADVSPDLAALLSGRSSAQQAEYRHRLGDALRRYATADGGVSIPNVTLCAAGRK